jgi:hypothetical protein
MTSHGGYYVDTVKGGDCGAKITTVTMHIGDVRAVMAGMVERGDTFDLLVTSPP